MLKGCRRSRAALPRVASRRVLCDVVSCCLHAFLKPPWSREPGGTNCVFLFVPVFTFPESGLSRNPALSTPITFARTRTRVAYWRFRLCAIWVTSISLLACEDYAEVQDWGKFCRHKC